MSAPERLPQYRLVCEGNTGDFTDRLNSAFQDGYRILQAFVFPVDFGPDDRGVTYIAIMELAS